MVNLVELLGREIFDSAFYSFIGLIVMIAAYYDIRDKNYPPGPLGMPIFGYLPMLNPKTPYNTLKELASHYGKVFGMHLGSVYTVVVTDVKLIKEALNMDSFHSKVPLQLANEVAQGNGILLAGNEKWKQHRFMLMSALKNMANTKGKGGRMILEDKIQAALQEFCQEIANQPTSGSDIRPGLKHSIGSLMFDVAAGFRPSKNDAGWNKLQNVFTKQFEVLSITNSQNFVPLLRNFAKYTKTLQNFVTGKDEAKKLVAKCTDKYSKADGENCQSILEAYIAEMQRKEGKSGENFSTEQISQVVLDTLSMGWETTLDSLQWLYIYLAMYPETQDFILSEMNLVLGSRRDEVSIENYKRLSYTQAVIMEVWRHRPVLPMGMPHCAAENTKIGKYCIREGTMIIPLIYAVHRDQRYWDKPDEFMPERHIEDDGSIRKSEYFIPFSTGKKACVGEELAELTVLLFLVALVKDYKISFAKGVKFSQDDLPDFNMTSKPPSYRLVFEPRN